MPGKSFNLLKQQSLLAPQAGCLGLRPSRGARRSLFPSPPARAFQQEAGGSHPMPAGPNSQHPHLPIWSPCLYSGPGRLAGGSARGAVQAGRPPGPGTSVGTGVEGGALLSTPLPPPLLDPPEVMLTLLVEPALLRNFSLLCPFQEGLPDNHTPYCGSWVGAAVHDYQAHSFHAGWGVL